VRRKQATHRFIPLKGDHQAVKTNHFREDRKSPEQLKLA